MLFSIAIILLLGCSLGAICNKFKLPSLLGMLFLGMIMGPFVLNLIDSSILNISSEIRKIALVIILLRAGLTLNISDLKKVGRPAILMCFLPAMFEIIGMSLLAPKLLGISTLEAVLLGTVIAAVSPAVIVPKMIRMIEEGYGREKGIPQLILAGAAVDDVFVIVLFTAMLGLLEGENTSIVKFINIPISIILGILIGWMVGCALAKIFQKIHMRDTIKVLVILSIALLLVVLEDDLNTMLTFSALISIMSIGVGLQQYSDSVAKRLNLKFNKLWVVAEILLFVLVGATVDISYIKVGGIMAVILLLFVMLFRFLGVYICLIGTKFTQSEKFFCGISFMPKATVQAAIGGIPLAMGLACGNIVLMVAVLSIIITAPVGAFLIDKFYQKILVLDSK